jgi:hypothetical protein
MEETRKKRNETLYFAGERVSTSLRIEERNNEESIFYLSRSNFMAYAIYISSVTSESYRNTQEINAGASQEID